MVFGLACSALGLLSPIDALAERSFIWHMLQHELIMSFAVPAILLSQPFLPVVWGLPQSFRRWVFIPLARLRPVQRTLRFLTHPICGLAAYSVAQPCWPASPVWGAAAVAGQAPPSCRSAS
jgi:cytochrome c oxidase assembly factor CtaG